MNKALKQTIILTRCECTLETRYTRNRASSRLALPQLLLRIPPGGPTLLLAPPALHGPGCGCNGRAVRTRAPTLHIERDTFGRFGIWPNIKAQFKGKTMETRDHRRRGRNRTRGQLDKHETRRSTTKKSRKKTRRVTKTRTEVYNNELELPATVHCGQGKKNRTESP